MDYLFGSEFNRNDCLTIWKRVIKANFSRILWNWLFTVNSEKLSFCAISLLVSPSEINAITCFSRFAIRTDLSITALLDPLIACSKICEKSEPVKLKGKISVPT